MNPLLLAASAFAGWREDAAAARAACATDPAPCAIVDGLFLRENRAGQTVAQDWRLAATADHPTLTALVLERLHRERDPAARRGLADAAVELLGTAADRGDPRWDDVWGELVADPQSDVRAVVVDALRRVPAAVAAPALRAAAAHEDPLTRADAARVMGGHDALVTFVPDLAALAADPSADVRQQCARALRRAAGLGPLPPPSAQALVHLEADADPRTRAAAAPR